ncbi:hypothetical protein HYALB_00009451 [Hymenoscyphus albidus]|uniref:Uncharacterized protein n=1 Tax=Hymenoscyphus albidus TaxID=595503 RepID=A0A9N9LNR3_9HELO|nr:hypothetical protein HYALB_00009451 [Hymenoscyphus albidus]
MGWRYNSSQSTSLSSSPSKQSASSSSSHGMNSGAHAMATLSVKRLHRSPCVPRGRYTSTQWQLSERYSSTLVHNDRKLR